MRAIGVFQQLAFFYKLGMYFTVIISQTLHFHDVRSVYDWCVSIAAPLSFRLRSQFRPYVLGVVRVVLCFGSNSEIMTLV